MSQKLNILPAKESDYKQEIGRLQGRVGEVSNNFTGKTASLLCILICTVYKER